ncbi:type I secretion system permease/ATPase [Methylobacterium sp. NPDC080182]|uniref:type I secretion system permease/ATPase n=1 Tax=Methylobacterium sp. NPDC080182 TaxID=3390590 RepID=UPI003D08EFD3
MQTSQAGLGVEPASRSPRAGERSPFEGPQNTPAPYSGFAAIGVVAGFYRIPAPSPAQLAQDLRCDDNSDLPEDVVRAAIRLGLRARHLSGQSLARLWRAPLPCILRLTDGRFTLLIDRRLDENRLRLLDPFTRAPWDIASEELAALWTGEVVLVTRRAIGGAGLDPRTFGFRWFLPSVARYKRPLAQALVASLFIQLFALVTPLFFQLVVDKVLVHKGLSTLVVLVVGLAALGLFDVTLQYLRTYVLAHTASRIDAELGARLFAHLMRLPLGYFETRQAGQTVARARELDTVRQFLTGQSVSSAIDLAFTAILVAVLFLYSPPLALVVVLSAPIYVLVATLVRPLLRERAKEKFNRGAQSQQFLVESVVGIQTIKAAAVEPLMRLEWEERLAAYVGTSFRATLLGALGQNGVQYVSKATTALILFFGARDVMAGTMSVGELIAFNMIAAQVTQPVLRLSQLWQDFQQVQISVERIGDILNAPVEAQPPATAATLPPAQGAIRFEDIIFRYKPGDPEVLRGVSLEIPAGQVVGIVGPSGSGKSTLTKLIQRLYVPEAGRVLLDGHDLTEVDPVWLRRQVGVVLQENLLFNRTLHENIAFAHPALPRDAVRHVAQLAGAHDFIARLPNGYDTVIEERGANLSGGQRQRIAIARALATNPRVLILDEATSALDYESEQVIQANMRDIVRGRTVIIISHRLAAVRDCDRILSVSDGRIVEDGTHESLLAAGDGPYAHFWRLQMRVASGGRCT